MSFRKTISRALWSLELKADGSGVHQKREHLPAPVAFRRRLCRRCAPTSCALSDSADNHRWDPRHTADLSQHRARTESRLLCLLPPLLFAAGWRLSWREFQANFSRILRLAVGLVIFTILVLIGTSLAFARLCFVLGCIAVSGLRSSDSPTPAANRCQLCLCDLAPRDTSIENPKFWHLENWVQTGADRVGDPPVAGDDGFLNASRIIRIYGCSMSESAIFPRVCSASSELLQLVRRFAARSIV
jgi:Sodium/hydrogen exchanger family